MARQPLANFAALDKPSYVERNLIRRPQVIRAELAAQIKSINEEGSGTAPLPTRPPPLPAPGGLPKFARHRSECAVLTGVPKPLSFASALFVF